MPWSAVRFGKHAGKTLPQILFADPDWFFWAVEEAVFKGKGPLEREAADIARKARSIRIPNSTDTNPLEAEYFIHPPTQKFSHMEIVSAAQPQHSGSSPSLRKRFKRTAHDHTL